MVVWSFATLTANHTESPMTKAIMDLSELLADQDGGDFLLGVSEAGLQLIKRGPTSDAGMVPESATTGPHQTGNLGCHRWLRAVTSHHNVKETRCLRAA